MHVSLVGGRLPEPLTHTMHWLLVRKNPTSIANNVPTYHHPWPPLPGKCDGERVSEPTPTPPGLKADLDAGPEAAPAQATDSASGMCAGRYILLTVLVS